MSIYSEFKPTYLYIKQHSITGLLYFGKTYKADPIAYNGSGMHWRRHVTKHGMEHIETLWYCLFTDQEECIKFALMFSKLHDIVKSPLWANMIYENGLGNGTPGRVCTDETKHKIGIANSGKQFSDDVNKRKGSPGNKNGMFGVRRCGESAPHYGIKHSEETINKLRISAKNRITSTCPHCHKVVDPANAKRWHFDQCKLFLMQQVII